jgi:hypothetical protein
MESEAPGSKHFATDKAQTYCIEIQQQAARICIFLMGFATNWQH